MSDPAKYLSQVADESTCVSFPNPIANQMGEISAKGTKWIVHFDCAKKVTVDMEQRDSMMALIIVSALVVLGGLVGSFVYRKSQIQKINDLESSPDELFIEK